MTTYSAGLRVSEVIGLKVTDIDSKRMMIRVQQGKGRRDRYTILSERLLKELRIYWKMYQPAQWLFFGTKKKSSAHRSLGPGGLQQCKGEGRDHKRQRHTYSPSLFCHPFDGIRSKHTNHTDADGTYINTDHNDISAGNEKADLGNTESPG